MILEGNVVRGNASISTKVFSWIQNLQMCLDGWRFLNRGWPAGRDYCRICVHPLITDLRMQEEDIFIYSDFQHRINIFLTSRTLKSEVVLRGIFKCRNVRKNIDTIIEVRVGKFNSKTNIESSSSIEEACCVDIFVLIFEYTYQKNFMWYPIRIYIFNGFLQTTIVSKVASSIPPFTDSIDSCLQFGYKDQSVRALFILRSTANCNSLNCLYTLSNKRYHKR